MIDVNVVAFGPPESRDWCVAVGSGGMSSVVAACPGEAYANAVADALRRLPAEELAAVESIREGADVAAAYGQMVRKSWRPS